MLLQLEIKNFAIIEKSIINFEKGFNVLTGETGAGKSILLDALSAILGERTSKDYIRKDEEKSELKAVFAKTDNINKKLKQIGINIQDDVVILERQLTKSGRSITKINGSIHTTQMMKDVSEILIEICGQREHQQLLKENHYVSMIDELAGEEHLSVLKEYQKEYKRYKEIEDMLDSMLNRQREQEQLHDLYKFQKQEIEEMDMKPGEDEKLESEKKTLSSFEKVSKSIGQAVEYLQVLDKVYMAQKELQDAAKFDGNLQTINDRLEKAYFELDDIKSESEKYFHTMEYDEERLNEVMNRLEVYKMMKRKYGDTIEEIQNYYEEISKKIDEVENKEEHIEKLNKEKKVVEKNMMALSTKLHNKRLEVAEVEGKKINDEIHELCMPHAKLQFEIAVQEEFNGYGNSKVNLLFSANKGEDLKALSKVASGGELSRVLLAMKIATNVEKEKVLFFDEVDEGVGGEVGRIIGEKLYKLGNKTQTITISHLPQVAAKADHHYLIEKTANEIRTVSNVRKLSHLERKDEIARMIYGEHADEITKKQAEEMLKK